MKSKNFFIVIVFLLALLSACAPQIPQTEDEVPRVTAEEAKSALESGKAILVDVRSVRAYAESHAAGAISIPLVQFETNIEGLSLKKDQWVIPYCS